MAALKDELSPDLIATMSRAFSTGALPTGATFDRSRFEESATEGLEELELKARISHIGAALQGSLPTSTDELASAVRAARATGLLDGWATLPVCEVVSDSMLDEPVEALGLLAELTPGFSAEFALRPFLEHHLDLTLETLHRWVEHPDEHVRRLVSEGTRPRLPWAPVFRPFVDDPSAAVALLDRLHHDPSEYVRRSVANHLNDIARDHPGLAVEIARRWQRQEHRPSVLRHGLRTLVKQGHSGALQILGFGPPDGVAVNGFTADPPTVPIGGAVTLALTLSGVDDLEAIVDYVVHYQGARGPKAGKVFKWTTTSLGPAGPVELTKQHRFAHVSIRRIHPGLHRIEAQVNGVVLAETTVEVTDDQAATASPKRKPDDVVPPKNVVSW